MSFTAEEVWSTLHADKEESVFLHSFHVLPFVADAYTLKTNWKRVREIRSFIQKVIEENRAAPGGMGSSLQAIISLTASNNDFSLLSAFADDLKFIMITSAATVRENSLGDAPIAYTLAVSTDPKCARCWHYRADVGSNAEHATLCGRCVSNLFGEGEKRFYA